MAPGRRIPLLLLGGISLLFGLAAGEGRLGWEMPARAYDLAALHGPLMICAFFGTVIGLERAVALNRAWGYLAPLLSGAGGAAMIAGLATDVAAVAVLAASVVFCTMAAVVVFKQRALFTVVMGLGGLSWLAGNIGWLAGVDVPDLVPLWACFLVLTIAGERLELSRFLPPAPDRAVTAPVPLALLPLAAVLELAGFAWAGRLFGLGLLLLALWLVRHDIARRTIRQTGLTGYMAACLLSGYAWLAVAGGLMLAFGLPPWGYIHDAALHALFVGFVFAMVFGHAPVILPAVLHVVVPFTRWFYVPLTLLHASVALRVGADLVEADAARALGGLLNGLAIVLFLIGTAALTITATRARARQRRRQRGGAPA